MNGGRQPTRRPSRPADRQATERFVIALSPLLVIISVLPKRGSARVHGPDSAGIPMVDERPRACQAMQTARIPLLYPCRTVDPGLRERRGVMQRLLRAFCVVVLGLTMTAPAFAQLSTAQLD